MENAGECRRRGKVREASRTTIGAAVFSVFDDGKHKEFHQYNDLFSKS